MIYERRHTRELEEFGGLWKVMPVYARADADRRALLDGPARPERIRRRVHHPAGRLGSRAGRRLTGQYLYAGFAALGVILAAVYMLFMFQKMFLGQVTNEANRLLKDLNWREIVVLVPLLLLIFWIGLFPQPFFEPDVFLSDCLNPGRASGCSGCALRTFTG